MILYSGHLFRRLNLSRNFRALSISGTYQAGRREDLTRLILMGACLSKHCMRIECHAAKSSSTVFLSVYDLETWHVALGTQVLQSLYN